MQIFEKKDPVLLQQSSTEVQKMKNQENADVAFRKFYCKMFIATDGHFFTEWVGVSKKRPSIIMRIISAIMNFLWCHLVAL